MCHTLQSLYTLTIISIAGVAEIILQGQIKLSLKCLAANAVKRHKLKYKGVVPKLLESFVDLHGPVNWGKN